MSAGGMQVGSPVSHAGKSSLMFSLNFARRLTHFICALGSQRFMAKKLFGLDRQLYFKVMLCR